jgi:hypothetical protein
MSPPASLVDLFRSRSTAHGGASSWAAAFCLAARPLLPTGRGWPEPFGFDLGFFPAAGVAADCRHHGALLVALCLEVYVVGRVVALTPRLSAATAGMLFVVFAGFWSVFPFSMRRLRDGN